MKSSNELLSSQKDLLRENIIAPLVETVIEAFPVNKRLVYKLIYHAKQSRLGRKQIERMTRGRYSPALCDALAGVSRIYEHGQLNLTSTFGSLAPSLVAVRAESDKMIDDIIHTYFETSAEEKQKAMRRCRQILQRYDPKADYKKIERLEKKSCELNLKQGSLTTTILTTKIL